MVKTYGKAKFVTRLRRSIKRELSTQWVALPSISNLSKFDTHEEEM